MKVRDLRRLLGRIVLGLGVMLTEEASAAPYFERVATMPTFLNLPQGADPKEETVAEIVAATPDGVMLVYTDGPGGRIGFVDIGDPAAPTPAGTVDVGGEPTSVTVVAQTVLTAVNTSQSFADPGGHVAVIDPAGRSVIATCDLGGQPDSIAASPDGGYLAVALENERDEDLHDGAIPQPPAGRLAIFELDGDGRPTNCDAVRMVKLTGLAEIAPEDPEPEFVDVNERNVAAVTLQENNHIVLVDLADGEVIGDFPAGTVDLDAIDTESDGVIAADGALENVRREPDAVAWLDAERLVTANEGDYEGGSRGFTIFSTAGEVLYDAGNLLEHMAIAQGHYPEHRAGARGVEPEAVALGVYGGAPLIFVSSERGNFVAVFEDGGAAAPPQLLQLVPTAVGPEGLLAIPERDLLVVATEVDSEEDGLRATIGIYARTAAAPPYPTIVSELDPATGAPIGWGALSGLAADPRYPDRLFAISDGAYGVSRILAIDAAEWPARITAYVALTRNGESAGYDLEGIAVRSGGGFWLAAEGDPESENPLHQRNLLLAIAHDGTVEQEIALPDAARAHATHSGFEGVARWGEGDDERVIVALQRPWQDDPENTAKLAIYRPADDSWRFVRYPLEAPKSERGGWVGLSAIVHVGAERFLVLERDNQPGSYAAIKMATLISLEGIIPAAYGATLPTVEKRPIIDLLPAMRASQGWIPDKPEGLAITGDGRVFMVTDNDGVDDVSGETQLLLLGMKTELNLDPLEPSVPQ